MNRVRNWMCFSVAVVTLTAAGCASGTGAKRHQKLIAQLELSAAPEVEQSKRQSEMSFSTASHLSQRLLVRAVFERNPSIESARQAWRQAVARYPQVTSLDDPFGGYRYAPTSRGDQRFGQVISIKQRLPFPGKRSLQGKVALAEAEAARDDYEATRLRLALVASMLFEDYYSIERTLEVNSKHMELVRELKQSAEVQHASGRGSQQDAIQAEVELSHLEHERIVSETERKIIIAQINGLLHRLPKSPLPPPPTVLPVPTVRETNTTDLQQLALSDHPTLHAVESRINGAESSLSLARREHFPDFTISGAYNSMWAVSDYRYTLGVSINLPVKLGPRKAAIEEARARLRQWRSDYAAQRSETRVEVAQGIARVEEARHIVQVYKDRLVPSAQDLVVAARSGFQSGKNSFLAVIESEKNLRTAEREFHFALADIYRRIAELDWAVGRLPGLNDKGETR